MAKRKDDVVKTKDGAGKQGAKAEVKAASTAKAGRKKAPASAEPAVVAEPTPEPARTKKAAKKKTAPAVVADPNPEPARTKKAAKKTAAPAVVADPTPEPARTKKAAKKSAAPAVVADPTPEPARTKKAAKKTAPAVATEPAPAPKKPKKPVADKAKPVADKAKPVADKAKPVADKAKPVADKAKPGRKKAAAPAVETVEPEAKPGRKTKKAGGKKAGGKKAGGKKAAAPTLAERLDKHRLYQLSVQSPEADLEFFAARYEELRGRAPKVLREDFCGTAYISATWAGSAKGRRAIGVDLDAATLQWGREHNLAPLSKDAHKRVELRQANVLDGGGTRSDMTCAMNFSYGVFKTRAELRHYFEVVYQQLADDGVFFTELYGGTEAIIAVQDEREIAGDEETGGDFTYLWEQAAYNPITHETLCHIHFRLSDGSTIEKAFTYDWRLWSIMEVRELLYEVGFTSVRVYWEATDEDGDGTGEYYATEHEENQESWLVYLVAGK